jgi:cellobiose phosphorylase
VLGVRPEWDGLRLDPCLPPGWDKVRVRRSYRGSELDIMIVRDGQGTVTIKLDGQPCAGNVVPATALDGKSHQVHVSC